MRALDLAGVRFGRLVALRRVGMPPGKGSVWFLAYSLDPQYYVAMCKPCHVRLDVEHRIGEKA